MIAKKPQNFEMPANGLFGDTHKQLDLIDAINGAGWVNMSDEERAKLKGAKS